MRSLLCVIAAVFTALYMLTIEQIAYFITRDLPRFKNVLKITEDEAI